MAPRVVIVTGASRGIGLSVAEHLIKQSHKVVLVARSADQLEALKAAHPDQVDYISGDLANFELAPRVTELALQRFGRLDGLVVNHGVLSPISRLADASVEEWHRLYNVNVLSGLALIKEAIVELRKSKGCVIWVSSGAATKAYTAWGAYGSSKAALNSISAHLAVEESAVCSIAFSPGRVDSDMQKELRELGKAAMRPADYESFASAFEKGEMKKPDVPGGVIARFVVKPKPELSGKFLGLTAPELADYQT